MAQKVRLVCEVGYLSKHREGGKEERERDWFSFHHGLWARRASKKTGIWHSAQPPRDVRKKFHFNYIFPLR